MRDVWLATLTILPEMGFIAEMESQLDLLDFFRRKVRGQLSGQFRNGNDVVAARLFRCGSRPEQMAKRLFENCVDVLARRRGRVGIMSVVMIVRVVVGMSTGMSTGMRPGVRLCTEDVVMRIHRDGRWNRIHGRLRGLLTRLVTMRVDVRTRNQTGTFFSISTPTWPAAISRSATTVGLSRLSIFGVWP